MAKSQNLNKKGISSADWVKIRKISQIVFFLIFLMLFFWSRREFYLNPSLESGIKEKLVNIPLKMDPLVMITQAISNRKIPPGFPLAILTILLSFLLGRVWCGWFCPMGTILEWIPIRKWNKKKPTVPEGFRAIKYVLLMVMLIAAIFSNLTLLFLDPLTIGYRTLTSAIWPGLDRIVTFLELQLIQVPFLSSAIGSFDSLIRPTLLPPHPATFRYGWLFFGFFALTVGFNALAPRFWCRYLCPLGGLFGLIGKISFLRPEIAGNCTNCGICLPDCPTGAIQETDRVFVDTGECTMCMVCGDSCPSSTIHFPFKPNQFIQQPYDLERRKVLISAGAAVLGWGLLETDTFGLLEGPNPLRPPGVVGDEFMQACIRCGECSTVCPTNAIQMAVLDGGVEGFWTPVLVPRIGYCDFSCQACGQVCPVEAIPPLSLEEKRKQVIGKAHINRERCLPWAKDEVCIVCEEMCPVSDKAIILEEAEVATGEGVTRVLQRPVVVREDCIGCGICEYKCPVAGDAAIQVWQHGEGGGGQHRRRGNWH